ncbi:MAG TPA: hypothetical protein VMY99_02705 [Nevskiaceae bacterium]|nr:hypothetical protein [Nevskiaceae bacterium]
MSDIIVLGLIPGTQIQITFVLWIIAVGGMCLSLLSYYIRRKRLLRDLLIAASFALIIRHPYTTASFRT